MKRRLPSCSTTLIPHQLASEREGYEDECWPTEVSHLSRLIHRISVSPFPNLSSLRLTLTRNSPKSSSSQVADCIAAERSNEGEVAALSAIHIKKILSKSAQQLCRQGEVRGDLPKIFNLKSQPSRWIPAVDPSEGGETIESAKGLLGKVEHFFKTNVPLAGVPFEGRFLRSCPRQSAIAQPNDARDLSRWRM